VKESGRVSEANGARVRALIHDFRYSVRKRHQILSPDVDPVAHARTRVQLDPIEPSRSSSASRSANVIRFWNR